MTDLNIAPNITFRSGDLFASGAQALVNPVNCVGVMGAGLALQFKRRYPEMFADYRAQCQARFFTPGHPRIWRADGHPLIVNFPTKDDWRNPSQLQWIRSGLATLAGLLRGHDVHSIAIPPLGCGLGGLEWPDVRDLIVTRLGGLDTEVVVYGPAPASSSTS
jgi:O-acetyl-ADP-ribose deacetylase (regulator of RNase III)